MNVFVTGATGFIGSHLTLELLNRGFSVSVLTRNKNAIFPLGVKNIIVGDLLSIDSSVIASLENCDILFHCAGEIKSKSLMNDLHIGGTMQLLDLLAIKAPSMSKRIRWVQLSSVGVYGPALPSSGKERLITENSPSLPKGIYEISKFKSDEMVEMAGLSRIIDYSILRPSNVIGSTMRPKYIYELIKAIHKRFFFYIGHRGAIATYVHVDDVVEALIQCAIKPEAVNQIFNISSDCTLESFVEEISCALGISPPKIRFSETFARNAEFFLSQFIRTPLTISRIDSLVSRTRYTSDKLIKTLGFKFSKPMPISIREIVNNYLDKR